MIRGINQWNMRFTDENMEKGVFVNTQTNKSFRVLIDAEYNMQMFNKKGDVVEIPQLLLESVLRDCKSARNNNKIHKAFKEIKTRTGKEVLQVRDIIDFLKTYPEFEITWVDRLEQCPKCRRVNTGRNCHYRYSDNTKTDITSEQFMDLLVSEFNFIYNDYRLIVGERLNMIRKCYDCGEEDTTDEGYLGGAFDSFEDFMRWKER